MTIQEEKTFKKGVTLLLAKIISVFIVPIFIVMAWNYLAPLFNGIQIEYWHGVAAYYLCVKFGGCFKSTTVLDED